MGFARRPWDDAELRQVLKDGLLELAPDSYNEAKWTPFAKNITYVQGDLSTPTDFEKLREHLEKIEAGPGNRLYYLATTPDAFGPILTGLAVGQLVHASSLKTPCSRVIVEKPFMLGMSAFGWVAESFGSIASIVGIGGVMGVLAGGTAWFRGWTGRETHPM